MQTVLRVTVEDYIGDARQLVAYETVVLGALRPGYRVLQLRSPLGTRIDGCVLFVRIALGETDVAMPAPVGGDGSEKNLKV